MPISQCTIYFLLHPSGKRKAKLMETEAWERLMHEVNEGSSFLEATSKGDPTGARKFRCLMLGINKVSCTQ